jgi:hypothetical protein
MSVIAATMADAIADVNKRIEEGKSIEKIV